MILKKSVFHIIDLAGSERQSETNSLGERIKEAGNINKSLLNLRRVIENIINNEKFIPYRDSKLTFFLKDSLGGNSKTSIIANISPSDFNNSETISTLNFANCAKKVKNKAIIKEEIIKNNNENIIEFQKLKDNYKAIFQENFTLKQQINNFQFEINQFDFNKIVDSAENNIDKMSDEMKQKNLEIDSKNEEIIKLKDQIQKYKLEISLKENQIEKLKNDNNELFEKLNKFNNNNNNFIENEKKDFNESNVKIKENEFSLISLEKNSNINLEINKLKLNYENLKKEFILINEEKNKEKNNYNKILNENNILKNEINNENKKFNDLKYKYNELTKEKQNVIQKYIKEIDNLYENETNFEKNLENYKKYLKDIENIINILKKKNEVFKNTIRSIEYEFDFYNINTIKDKLYNNSRNEYYKLIEHEDMLIEIINKLTNITNNTYNNNLPFQIFNMFTLIYKILTLKIKQNFNQIWNLHQNQKSNINELSDSLRNKESQLISKINILDNNIYEINYNLSYINEKLNLFNDLNKKLKKSNKIVWCKIKTSLIQQKRNYEEFKSAKKENINSKNIQNPFNNFSEKKIKKDFLDFNNNEFSKNLFN